MSNSNRTDRAHAAMLAAAEVYIHSERSDPFTRDRVMSHIKNGIATPYTVREGSHGTHFKDWMRPAYYEATEYAEDREYETENGTVKYKVPAYKNVVRP